MLEENREITTPNHLQNDLKKIKRKLNLPNEVNLSFHKLKDNYAAYYLENGASLEFVRKTIGHHNLTITQKYLHLSNYKLQEEHMLTSPINTLQVRHRTTNSRVTFLTFSLFVKKENGSVKPFLAKL